jgi:hypothetical protein
MLDCRDVDSVLEAVEKRWLEEPKAGGSRIDVYEHLAIGLNADGYIADNENGLTVLAHCRRAGLPIVDVQEELESRVRRAGYVGGPLNLADYARGSTLIYVFFDSRRFDRFAEVRDQLGLN